MIFEKLFTGGLVDELAPQHTRTSCIEGQLVGNEYFNEYGTPRCVRCALQYRMHHGEWPHGVKVRVMELSFDPETRTD